MLSDIELRCIFSNLASIIPINETLLDSLQKRVTGWLPDRSVGDIFFEMVRDSSSSPHKNKVSHPRLPSIGTVLKRVHRVQQQLQEGAGYLSGLHGEKR